MRCWQAALQQISDYKEDGRFPRAPPQSETETALADSLHLLELQCRERVDLLSALRLSRQVDGAEQPIAASEALAGRGWIGGGTIPAVTYTELSRPALPPRSSSGPTLNTVTGATERPAIPERLRSGEGSSAKEALARGASPLLLQRPPKDPRPRSPEKHTLRSTLRTGGKPGERQPKGSYRPASKPSEGPSRAAAAAWGALGFGSRSARAAQPALSSAPTATVGKDGSEDKTPRALWDSHSRRFVTSPTEGRLGADAVRPSRRSGETASPRPDTLSVNAAASAHLASTATPNRYPDERPPRQRTAPAAAAFPVPRHGDDASAPVPASARRPRPSNDAVMAVGGNGGRPTQPFRGPSVEGPGPSGPLGAVGEAPARRKKPAGGVGRGAVPDQHAARRLSWPKHAETEEGRADLPPASKVAGQPPDWSGDDEYTRDAAAWNERKQTIIQSLAPGVDEAAAGQILNEILIRGDEVRWSDVAGLGVAKSALREAVVYPFLRPDLFLGLREPIRGILLFGPPGTGKTLLARAVATESKSTFFSISASSLTSKYLGESEKLVRALFALARQLAPSIIFVDEIDSLLAHRSGSGEHEATRRIKSEFLIQWSDLQRAAAGRDTAPRKNESGDASRVLVLGATNLPWAIDEAARRRFARRQYIPLPEAQTRGVQLKALLAQQKHGLAKSDINELIGLTEGISDPLSLSPQLPSNVRC